MNVQSKITDIERARSALWSCDPNVPRAEWVRIGMAAKAAGLEFEDFNDWSATAANYGSAADCASAWKSFTDAGGVNPGTLFHAARSAGWKDPEAKAATSRKGKPMDVAAAWDKATAAPANHDYIIAKGGKPDGLRMVNWDLSGWAAFKGKSLRGWLIVPIRDRAGALQSLQFIGPNGGAEKLNAFGCPVAGGAFKIGMIENVQKVYVVEGLGHAWTAATAMAAPSIVTFGKAHLAAAGAAVLAAGGRPVLVADRGGEADTAAAAARLGCPWVAMPDDLRKGQDINDLHKRDGIEAARRVLQAERAPAASDNTANSVPLGNDLNPAAFPHRSSKGQLQSTVENVAHLLTEYGISVCYNVISKDLEIEIPGQSFAIDNRAGDNVATITSLCARNGVPKTDLMEYITLIGGQNRRNPALEWIEATPWDGQDRFGDLVETLDPADADLSHILLRRWMIGAAAAAASENGVAMQGVLVLQGPQNSGKTTWFWSLAGGRDRGLMLEGAMLNPADRDSVKSAISHWLVELGELDATFRKADIAALKSFITKDRDELFLRYSRASSSFPRRTAFGATVNEGQYLRDETGNRRYWTIACGKGLNGLHPVNVQQVWAQALDLWRKGEPHNLQRDELARLNGANKAHEEVSPVEEIFLAKFDWKDPRRTEHMSATEALIAVGYDRPNRQQTREASMILRKLTGGEPRKSGSRIIFDVPPRVSPYGGEAF